MILQDAGRVPLTDAMSQGMAMAATRYGRELDLQYSSQKRVKNEAIRAGLIEQHKKGRSYVLELTEGGANHLRLALADEESSDRVKMSSEGIAALVPPYRVGANHMMPSSQWRGVMSAVALGEVDVIVVPRSRRTPSVDYWDEVTEA